MSVYALRPTTNYCDESGYFSQCRVYDSFMNRRYFVVARSSQTTSIVRLNGTAYFPPSEDASSSFFNTLIYWTDTTNYYYIATYNNDQLSSPNVPNYLSPTSPTNDLKPSIFGSLLYTYKSSIVIGINMNGKNLYSKTTTLGGNRNSFIKVTLSGFTSLYGCAASLKNRPRSLSSPFIC